MIKVVEVHHLIHRVQIKAAPRGCFRPLPWGAVPSRPEKATSLWIEDHKVSATANKDSLKKHGRQ